MKSSIENKVIVITRSADQSKDSIQKLEALGAVVIPLPTIKITALDNYSEFDRYSSDLENFDYLIFTSTNAVKYFVKRTDETGIIIPASVKVAAVGKKTAVFCKENNINVDIIPEEYSAAGLLANFAGKDIRGKRFLIPSSEIAKDDLKKGLEKNDAEVTKVDVYKVARPDETELVDSLNMIDKYTPDIFIFTSPSTFDNFLQIKKIEDVKNFFAGTSLAAIGSVTASHIKTLGLHVDVVPDNYTMDDLIEAIIKFFTNDTSIEL